MFPYKSDRTPKDLAVAEKTFDTFLLRLFIGLLTIPTGGGWMELIEWIKHVAAEIGKPEYDSLWKVGSLLAAFILFLFSILQRIRRAPLRDNVVIALIIGLLVGGALYFFRPAPLESYPEVATPDKAPELSPPGRQYDIKAQTLAIQDGLKRGGCLLVEPTGTWGPKTRAALVAYNAQTGHALNIDGPSDQAADEMAGITARVCPLTCKPTEMLVSDICTPITCSAGLELQSDGKCLNPSGRTDFLGTVTSLSTSNGSTPVTAPTGTSDRAAAVNIDELRLDRTPLISAAALSNYDKGIARLRAISVRGGWPQISGNRIMQAGDEDERVPHLRNYLIAAGLLERGDSSASYLFDAKITEAVMEFQRRNGLRPTGRVDQPTLAAINVPASIRLAELEVSRMQVTTFLTKATGRYVLVNIPAFELEAVDEGVVQARHRVIVGRTGRHTPTGSGALVGYEFLPRWSVPTSVVREQLLPTLRGGATLVEEIRLFQRSDGKEVALNAVDWKTANPAHYNFVQIEGPGNAQGLIRLSSRNLGEVGIHDTPWKPLFLQRSRAFSAGSVSVQDIFALADWIGRDKTRPVDSVEKLINAGKPASVRLPREIPIHLVYLTAWVESDGVIQFRPDIYRVNQGNEALDDTSVEPKSAPWWEGISNFGSSGGN